MKDIETLIDSLTNALNLSQDNTPSTFFVKLRQSFFWIYFHLNPVITLNVILRNLSKIA